MSMRFGFGFAAAISLFACASARGQIFYEPVRVQYTSPTGQTFYYAGSNPHVFEFVEREDCRYRDGYYAKDSHVGANGVQRIPVSPAANVRIYSDCAPYENMTDHGWSTSDAINEANAQMPRYYRRADFPPAGAPGVWVVPASGEPAMQVEPPIVASGTATAPAVGRGTILIIPRRLLKPDAKGEQKTVASAR